MVVAGEGGGGAAVLAVGFGVLVSGLFKLKEEEAIGRNAGDVGDEESIDLAGETGAVDGVGDFGAGCGVVIMPGNNARIGVAGGGGDVTAGGRG